MGAGYWVDMKGVLFILAIIMYLILYGGYIYTEMTIPYSRTALKIWNYSCIGGLTLSMLLLYLSGIHTFLLQQLFIISFIILLVTFTIIILVNLLILSNPYYILSIFYGSNFVFTIMILISGLRHGVFKD